MHYLAYPLNVALLALGFGFVIFFHELGHFLAAKWVGIKVEQFAVGFGSALVSWRKGIGFRLGGTEKEYRRRIQEHVINEQRSEVQLKELAGSPSAETMDRAAAALKLGETEYRLNWIPLGGYVKMLGQDDIKPGSEVDDPRAYNRQPIGARMLVVSAGVIMNIFLAAVGFMILFSLPNGFPAPPAIVGGVVPGSPAQRVTRTVNGKPQTTSLQVGDRILYYDGKWQHDFTKISLNAALSKEGVATPIYVRHVDGSEETFQITPERDQAEGRAFLTWGVEAPHELRGLDAKDLKVEKDWEQLAPLETRAVDFGDWITHVNGEPVRLEEYYKFDRALQASGGKPLQLTVKKADGTIAIVQVPVHFQRPFGQEPLNIAGMMPRAAVAFVEPGSPARGKVMPGDAIKTIVAANDPTPNPTAEKLMDQLNRAGRGNQPVILEVIRGGEIKSLPPMIPNLKVAKERYGLKIRLDVDDKHPVVAGTAPGSPAYVAGIPDGATITAVNGLAVSDWFQVRDALLQAAKAEPGKPISVSYDLGGGKVAEKSLTLNESDVTDLANIRYTTVLLMHDREEPRKASNPLQAASWGASETRDFVLSFYLTLRRMFEGSISYSNMMGPLGIFSAGTQFAFKGKDWLLWFLSMISANLAVVNFLPIPIVDGGLFTFLILEKIKGRPLSPRTQSIAQVVGLALLLGVFLLVTYQDISRMISPS